MSGETGFKVQDALCVRETEKAILVEASDLPDQQMWIPKSCVHDDSEVFKKDDEGTLVVMEWFATKNGLT
jgi:hypothetical protein